MQVAKKFFWGVFSLFFLLFSSDLDLLRMDGCPMSCWEERRIGMDLRKIPSRGFDSILNSCAWGGKRGCRERG